MTIHTIIFDDATHVLVPREPTQAMADAVIALELAESYRGNVAAYPDIWDALLSAAPMANQQQDVSPVCWRCFHCDEMFTNEDAARDHFGRDDWSTPACHIAQDMAGLVAFMREQEAELNRYRAEDHESARNFYRIGGEHSVALKREEECGYARGLADARKHPEELGLQPIATQTAEYQAGSDNGG